MGFESAMGRALMATTPQARQDAEDEYILLYHGSQVFAIWSNLVVIEGPGLKPAVFLASKWAASPDIQAVVAEKVASAGWRVISGPEILARQKAEKAAKAKAAREAKKSMAQAVKLAALEMGCSEDEIL